MHTGMSVEEILEEWEMQRKRDLFNARQMRDQYQREVDRLEKLNPLKYVSTASES